MQTWKADWTQLARDWVIQAKDPSRVSLVDCARTGEQALRLTTLPGDENIVGSGDMRRCDLYRCVPGTADAVVYGEGSAHWLAHSVLFPDDFQFPRWYPYIVANYHGTGESKAANFHVNFRRDPKGDELPGLLQLQRFTGDPMNPTEHYVVIGKPERNVFYDFMHHFRWSSKSDGYARSWLNGKLIMEHSGPTLYAGQGTYFKISAYHLPVPQAEIDQLGYAPTPASSVIHDRVRVGATRASVE